MIRAISSLILSSMVFSLGRATDDLFCHSLPLQIWGLSLAKITGGQSCLCFLSGGQETVTINFVMQ